MTFSGYFEALLASRRADWVCHPCWGPGSGPSYRDAFVVKPAPGERRALAVESHSYLAVYKNDLSLSLAWGLPSRAPVAEEWVAGLAEQSASSVLVDFFYGPSLVYRDLALDIDGGRVYLPLPARRDGRLLVPRRKVEFFKLLDALTPRLSTFDESFARA